MKEELPEELRREYIRAAYYFYKMKLTQEEIAGKMNISRQRVNRILGKCESLGIVQISIPESTGLYLDLEAELEKRFGLKAVRIAGNSGPQAGYADLGEAAANYLAGILKDGDVVGVSRGRSTASLADRMPLVNKKNLTVAQLMGGWNGNASQEDVDDIVSRFAGKLRAETCRLYAPFIVQKPEIRRSITAEPYFKKAYSTVKSCSIAAVGIGVLEKSLSLVKTVPGLEEEDFRGYLEKDAAGEICAHFFDVEGRSIETELDSRIISVELEDFLRIPVRIGIAGLPEKRRAVLGALKGRYINVLVTDPGTAEALLSG